MRLKTFSLLLIGSALLLFSCSKKASTSSATDDPITTTTYVNYRLALNSDTSIYIDFKKIPISSTESLWVSATEITQKQYRTLLSDTTLLTEFPVTVNWYDAARFANEVSAFLHLQDSVYICDTTRKSFKPLRLRLSPYVIIADDSISSGSGIVMRQKPIDSIRVLVYQICSAGFSASDTALATRNAFAKALLSLSPDSIRINQTTLKIYPHGLNRDSLSASLIRELKNTGTLVAYKHAYRLLPSSATYNTPLPSDTTPFSGLAPTNLSVTLLDSAYRAGYLLYFAAIPSESLLNANTIWSYAYPSPDTIKDSPRTFQAMVWTENSTSQAVRLPTVDEWEYIARCGTTISYSTYNGKLTAKGAIYGQASASTVASLPANPWGLFDMTGNVAEWTNDWSEGDPNISQAPFKVAKGGSFRNAESDTLLKITSNYATLPDSIAGSSIGFRLVVPTSIGWK